MISTALALALLMMAGQPSRALEARRNDDHPYHVQASALLTVQPEGRTNHRISPPLAGHAFGFSIGVGRSLHPVIAVEGEFLYGGGVSRPQEFRYNWNEDYLAYSRDVILNGLVRLKHRGLGPAEFLVGGGLAFTESGKRDVTRTDSFFRPRAAADELSVVSNPLLTVGVEVPLAASRRTAVVPAVRVRWRGGSDDYMGVNGFAVHFGVGVRRTF